MGVGLSGGTEAWRTWQVPVASKLCPDRRAVAWETKQDEGISMPVSHIDIVHMCRPDRLWTMESGAMNAGE